MRKNVKSPVMLFVRERARQVRLRIGVAQHGHARPLSHLRRYRRAEVYFYRVTFKIAEGGSDKLITEGRGAPGMRFGAWLIGTTTARRARAARR